MARVANRIGLLRLDPVNPAVTRMKRAPPGHPWSPPRTGGAFAHSIPEPPRSRKPRRPGTRLGGAEAAEVGGAGPISSAGGTLLEPNRTALAPLKPVPVIVTVLPPPGEPWLGSTLVTVGPYVKWSASLVVLVPTSMNPYT